MIWKYEFDGSIESTIKMPKDAKILTIQTQNDIPCIWISFNIKYINELESRVFETKGKGISFEDDDNLHYIGTYQVCEYVFHVYERK